MAGTCESHKEKTESITQFKKDLVSGKVFFFIGAGVSFDSNIPRADEMLSRVLSKTALPRYFKLKRYERGNDLELTTLEHSVKKGDLLPEQFYGMLLRMTDNNPASLNIFRSLVSDVQEELKPNFVHYFIVLSAYVSGLPVFTVNFDTMLEDACHKLGISCNVYTYNEADLYENAKPSSRGVAICKVHGSVGKLTRDVGVPIDAIKTTVNDIAKPNDWSRVIKTLMAENAIALAGYSGRDADICPSIVAAAKTSDGSSPVGRVYWFEEWAKAGGATKKHAKNARALLIDDYPSGVFPDLYKELPSEFLSGFDAAHASRINAVICKSSSSRQLTKEDKERRRSRIDRCALCLPEVDKEVLCLLLLEELQLNDEGYELTEEILKEVESEAAKRSTDGRLKTVLRSRTRLARECSCFVEYRTRVKKLTRMSWDLSDDGELAALENARLQLVSSWQMRMANFEQSKIRLPLYISILNAFLGCGVLCGFWVLKAQTNIDVKRFRQKSGREPDAGFREICQELENRMLALEFHLAARLGYPHRYNKWLSDRLLSLGRKAIAIGNTATIKGVVRRIDKIGSKLANWDDAKEYLDENAVLYECFKDPSQNASMKELAQGADDKGDTGQTARSRDAIRKYEKLHHDLDVFKALVRLGNCDEPECPVGFLRSEEYDRLLELRDDKDCHLSDTLILRLCLRYYCRRLQPKT